MKITGGDDLGLASSQLGLHQPGLVAVCGAAAPDRLALGAS
jgi:hypothetical protein